MGLESVFIRRGQVIDTGHLDSTLNWRANDGDLTKLLDVWASLPAEADVRFSPDESLAQQIVEITNADGNPVATFRVRNHVAWDSSAIVLVVLRIDSKGRFFAEAFCGGQPLVVSCKTYRPATRTTIEVPAETQASSPDALGVYVGIVQQGCFKLLIEPDAPLPALGEAVVDAGEECLRSLFFDLMVVEASELYDDEIASLEEIGSFDLIDDDKDYLLEFSFEEETLPADIKAFGVRIALDTSRRLSATAFDIATKKEMKTRYEGDDAALSVGSKASPSEPQDDRKIERASALLDTMFPLRAVGLFIGGDFPSACLLGGTNEGQISSRDPVESSPVIASAKMQRVFVSHRTAADGKLASQVVDWLEEQGVACWVAPRDIKAGANWNRSIMAAVAHCTDMVVIISKASFESDFLQAEVHRAFKLGKRVIPIHLEPNLPCTDIDVRFETLQHVEWWGGEDMALEALKQALS